ncbi:MAG: hypothetical protein LBV51_05030 [Acholeplasmatales bacterium]|jgi:V/A-type H+-transporting ATPase subunit E|nr:hypothetical protein [Acholeplasmatales bacterium]
MAQDILEYLNNLIEEKVKSFKNSYIQTIDTLFNNRFNDMSSELEKKYEKLKDNKLKEHAEKISLLNQSYAKESAKVKKQIVNELINDAILYLASLENDDLLELVYKLLLKENEFSFNNIYVSSKNFSKYKKALSSNNKNICDKLNFKLSFNNITTIFTLCEDKDSFFDGFIIKGTDYDLNFDFNELIQNKAEVIEKNIMRLLD